MQNNFKTALRFLNKNKVFAGINAFGLAIALSASFIILLYVINELSYNHCHQNRKSVYRVLNFYMDFNVTMAGTPYVLASALKEQFPQVEKAVNTKTMRDFELKTGDEFIPAYAMATTADIFDVFTIPLVMGTTSQHLLEDLNSLVISQDLAEKLFPGQNPVGKEITALINNEEQNFIIRGVYENFPKNSTLQADCFVNSRWTLDPINKTFGLKDADKNWTMDFWNTWLLISNKDQAKLLEDQFAAFEIRNISEKPHNHYKLQNLPDVYLHSESVANSGIAGNMKNIRLFFAIALIILLVSSINYIILSTAVSTARSKEIGIRKTYGAQNKNIRGQMLSESVFLTLLVLPVSLVLMWLSMPFAGRLFQAELHIIPSNLVLYIPVYLALALFIGVASGIYTSSYLSKLKVLDILKNTIHSGKNRFIFRSFLIVIQLVIFCSFVASTLVIRSQYQYALNMDPGYYNSDILAIDLGRDFTGYSSYLQSVKSHPEVIMAAGVMEGLPMEGSMSFMMPNFQDKSINVQVEGLAMDYNYIKTMGINVLHGREFSEDFGSDLANSAILNETAVRQLGITDPVGKLIGSKIIIGVVKDFNLHSIHKSIPPLQLDLTDKYITQLAVHYKPGTLQDLLPKLEKEWVKISPDKPFNYATIEDLTKNLYASEKNLTVIVSIFALFTILIASFGLFGLTLFFAKTRTKEIGIRRVFGCTEQSILTTFLKEYMLLVLIASLAAIPITLHFIKKWLSNYAYKPGIDWWVFAVAFLVAAIVVLFTVSWHALKASRTNPVVALRYE